MFQVLCNGPGTCVPLCAAGLLLGILGLKRVLIVYVESICRVETLSLSGKILYYLSDYFFVQWAPLKDKYPKSIYLGRLEWGEHLQKTKFSFCMTSWIQLRITCILILFSEADANHSFAVTDVLNTQLWQLHQRFLGFFFTPNSHDRADEISYHTFSTFYALEQSTKEKFLHVQVLLIPFIVSAFSNTARKRSAFDHRFVPFKG